MNVKRVAEEMAAQRGHDVMVRSYVVPSTVSTCGNSCTSWYLHLAGVHHSSTGMVTLYGHLDLKGDCC